MRDKKAIRESKHKMMWFAIRMMSRLRKRMRRIGPDFETRGKYIIKNHLNLQVINME
jgi:hypothetical protein